MKKILVIALSLLLLLFAPSCADEAIECGVDSVKSEAAPKGEHTLTVVDPFNSLYEELKASYKPGERIAVKTHIVHDAETVVELNGEKPVSTDIVKDENGIYIYNEYIFNMPSKNSLLKISYKEGNGEGFDVTLNDPKGYVVNKVEGMKMAGESYEINSLRSGIVIEINGTPVAQNPQAIKNSDGEILYYSWSFTMPREDTVISILEWAAPPSEVPKYTLSFIVDESAESLFEDTYSGKYSQGDKITIEPVSGVLDAWIILKANGVRLEEAEYNRWEFTMPDCDVTIDAFTVVDKMAEGYSFLNIEDKSTVLSNIYDGYYEAGETVRLYTKLSGTLYEPIIEFEGQDVEYTVNNALSKGACQYVIEFVMPSEDITLKIDIK